MKTRLKFLALLVTLSTFLACRKEHSTPNPIYPVEPTGKYSNGFFIVNEGWAGHDPGEITFYDYATGKFTDSIYKRENPKETLGGSWNTNQFATIFNHKLYILTKAGGPLTVASAATLQKEGQIAGGQTYDWRAFLGLNNSTGLVSTTNGVYLLNLNTLSLNLKVSGADGVVGDMAKAGKHIFMHSRDKGVLVFGEDYQLKQTMNKNITMGFAVTPNGKVWYTGGKYLYNIDSKDLKKDSVELSFTTYSSWGAWHAGSIVASTTKNEVYFVRHGRFGGEGSQIFRYVDGDKASVANPFIINPAKQVCYGKGIGFDPKTQQLLVTTVQSGWGENYAVNNLYFYDATGQLKNTIAYSGYHFPALMVFK